MGVCLKCGGSGTDSNGKPCDKCSAGKGGVSLPVILEIPEQYQAAYFDVSFLPQKLHASYGSSLQSIVAEVKTSYTLSRNVLICAPPNSGKTVFAYTLYRIMAGKGLPVADVYDLNEVRKLMSDLYDKDGKYSLFITVKIAVVKLPLDLPMKFVETIATILDLRLRRGGKTIFIYDGSKEDLIAQDKYDRLRDMIGDGSYHTMACYSYSKDVKKEEGIQ